MYAFITFFATALIFTQESLIINLSGKQLYCKNNSEVRGDDVQEMSRNGHRKRAKEKLIQTSTENLDDYQLLECLLFYSIPRIDVKELAYDLVNHFGSVDGVLSAPIDDLLKIDGIGENTATLIKLSKKICEKVSMNKNETTAQISNYIEASQYAHNVLQYSEVEKFLVITLNNNMQIISSTVIAQGYSNHAKIEPYKIVNRALNDKATSVIVAHNHPNGQPTPSQADIDFTLKIISLLRPMKIKLCDHIIVGRNNCCSMSIMPDTAQYFKESSDYSFVKE